MEMNLEPGAWAIDTERRFPTRFGVRWEELHEIENAPKEFPFLEKRQSCALTETQTQRLLKLLQTAPLYKLQDFHESESDFRTKLFEHFN